jgi:hypothetical protein
MVIALAIGAFCSAETEAKKPPQPPAADDPVSYTLVTLDDREGFVRGLISDVTMIGDSILCVGYLDQTDGDRAVMWAVTPSSSGYDVATNYLTDGEAAFALNANGEAVGVRKMFDAETQLWLSQGLYWPSPDGPPVTLAHLAGDNETEPLGINSAGIIVGRSNHVYETTDANGSVVCNWEYTAVAWATDVVNGNGELAPVVLGDPSESSGAHDVNNCDDTGFAQVVGMADGRPVLWQIDCVTLESTGPTLLVPEDIPAGGPAEAVSDVGDICGTYDMLAFRHLNNGTFEQLSTPRSSTSVANDINDQQTVVGRVWVWNRTGGLRETYGAMWKADGKQVELNDFLGRSGWQHIHQGTAITSPGIIAATGVLEEDHESRALLLISE